MRQITFARSEQGMQMGLLSKFIKFKMAKRVFDELRGASAKGKRTKKQRRGRRD